jgi:hypothetical protein
MIYMGSLKNYAYISITFVVKFKNIVAFAFTCVVKPFTIVWRFGMN